jgi:tRNA-dihydrouridine synthase
MATALLHAQMLALESGERMAMHQMRAHIHHYVKGFPSARYFRREANQLETLQGLRALVMRYVESLRADRQPGFHRSAVSD